jgi:glutaminyl-peptide cyclotransferase
MSSIAGEGPGMSRLTGSIVVVVIVLVALGCILMYNPFAMRAEPPPKKTPPTDFAADRNVPGGTPVPFEPKRAMSYLDDLCAIGPRISGTDGMKKQQDLLKKHFEELGGKVELQKFTARQKSQKQPVEMANLIVSWNPDRPRRVILCSHYDTRPIADQEPNPRKWHEPFLSANDGGSGVALLMELGNHMKELKAEVGVDFVFFDGEEYIFEKNDKYFFGSENFADQYKSRKDKDRKYRAAVLLDMVGGKEARFPVEPTSWFQGAAVVQEIWAIAAEQKCPLFQNREGTEVQDDHVALGRADIPAIDIIDFSYPHWHRLTDLPENCSGETLEQVARVLSVWLQRVK